MATWNKRWLAIDACVALAGFVVWAGRFTSSPRHPSPDLHLSGTPSSLSDWLVQTANRALFTVTDWPLAHGVTFSTDPHSAVVATGTLAFTFTLVIVALRQLVRWRRERFPWPIDLRSITVHDVPTDSSATLVDVMRDHLTRAGVLPHPFGTGPGAVLVDVSAALEVTGDRGWLGTTVDALKGVATVTTGFQVTGVLAKDHDKVGSDDEENDQYRLTFQIDDAQTGRTIAMRSVCAGTPVDCAKSAAYEVMMALARLEVVDRRTAPHQRWTSASSLQDYTEGCDALDERDWPRAVKQLAKAARSEPANALIQQRFAEAELSLANTGARDSARHHLASLEAALRALARDDRSFGPHRSVALVCGYAAEWTAGWSTASEARRRDILLLLERVGHGDVALLLRDPATPDAALQAFLELAEQEWTAAVDHERWPSIARSAWHLRLRRQFSGEVWLYRRKRWSRQDLLKAARIATRYDRCIADNRPPDPASDEDWLAELNKIRHRRWQSVRRIKELESSVQYNVAAAYARRAVALSVNGRLDQISVSAAIECLDETYSGAGEQLSKAELEFLSTDPDFRELVGAPEFVGWRAQFVPS